MVRYHHDLSYLLFGIKAPRGIGNEECLHAQLLHHANGEGNFLHGIALVVMEAPLHGKHLFASQGSDKQGTAMAFNRRNWEVRNILIGNFKFYLNLASQVS